MKKFIIFIIFLFSGCALYSEEMRAENEPRFNLQCHESNPSANPQEIQMCVARKHTEEKRIRRENFDRTIRTINSVSEGIQKSLEEHNRPASAGDGPPANSKRPAENIPKENEINHNSHGEH